MTVVRGDRDSRNFLTSRFAEGEHMPLETLIEETPGVSGGYPCVGDTRIRVGLLVEAFREMGNLPAVAERFDLDPMEVRAALDYYKFNRERVDEDIRRNRPSVTER